MTPTIGYDRTKAQSGHMTSLKILIADKEHLLDSCTVPLLLLCPSDNTSIFLTVFLFCRKDMAALEHRAATLDLSEPCARCGIAVGEPPPTTAGPSGGAVPPFFLFPSGNAFHGSCLAAETSKLAPAPRQKRIAALLSRLSQVCFP